MTNPKQTDDPIEFHMGHLLSYIRSRLTGTPTTDPAEQDEYIAELKELVEAGIKQAREDAFNLLRDAFKHSMQDDRWTFINYCLNGWIESGAQGFLIVEYDAGLDDADLRLTPGMPKGTERRPAKVVAINQGDEYYDDRAVKMILASGKVCTHCGTPLTQRDGTWVDRTDGDACSHKTAETHEPEQALFEVTHETIELGLQRIRHAMDAPDAGPHPEQKHQTTVPYLGQGLRNSIIEADLTNECSNLDVWSYTAIVEIALLGRVEYA